MTNPFDKFLFSKGKVINFYETYVEKPKRRVLTILVFEVIFLLENEWKGLVTWYLI